MRARAPPRIPPDGWPTTQPTTRIGLESLAFKATTDPIHVLQENYGIPRTDANTLLPDWKQPSYYTMANILSLQSVVSGWSCKRAYSLPCTLQDALFTAWRIRLRLFLIRHTHRPGNGFRNLFRQVGRRDLADL